LNGTSLAFLQQGQSGYPEKRRYPVNMHLSNLETGMTVYGSDGEKLGTIDNIYRNTATLDTQPAVTVSEAVETAEPRSYSDPLATGSDPTDTFSYAETEVIAPAAGSDGEGYIHLKEGGILGIGAKDLYIPFSAIIDVDPGECVGLNVTKAEANESFTNVPDLVSTYA
jgi:hypothetical protein